MNAIDAQKEIAEITSHKCKCGSPAVMKHQVLLTPTTKSEPTYHCQACFHVMMEVSTLAMICAAAQHKRMLRNN